MLDFIAKNAATIIISAILLAAVIAIVRGMVRRVRRGQCATCEGCNGCDKGRDHGR